MKNRYKLLSFSLLILFFISCEDYLKTESLSVLTEDSAFENYDFAKKVVNGIYADLTNIYLYGQFMGLYYKCDNDIECTYAADDGGKTSLMHYAGHEGCTSLKQMWDYSYQTIEQANICIDKLPQSPVWEGEFADDVRCLYGEAVTLRALMYSEMISLWGDVPFVIKSSQAGDNFYLPKTERDSIYEYLIQDLKNVEEYVPWMSETTERINKGFIKGLRARMAMAYAGYSLRNKTLETRRGRYWEDYLKIANQECREILESGRHQLNPEFESIFRILHEYGEDLAYKEVLFEIPFGRLINGYVGYLIGMAHATNDPKYGKSGAPIFSAPSYFYSFDRSDVRRNVSVELYNYSSRSALGKQALAASSCLSFSLCKWRKEWLNPSMGGSLQGVAFTGIDWPLMRFADVVLLFAETENEINNGPTQAAKDALSLIRRRAFSEDLHAIKVVNYVDSVSVSKESFFNAIVDERAWEFGGELIRKNDLIRWNLMGAKIKQMKEEYQKMMDISDPEYSNLVPTYIFWKYKEDGESLDILNPDYRLPSTAIPGYSRTSWLPLLSSSNKEKYIGTLDRVAHGYDETKNNHLYPISLEIITSSNGALSNDQLP